MAIADCSHKCALLFDQLTHQLGSNENGAELSTAALSDEYGRFKIWAANIGAFHPGTSSRSLDYRLREASQMGDQVEKILKDLKVSLGECVTIVSGQRPQHQSPSSDEEELDDHYSDLSDSDSAEDPSSSANGRGPVSELSELFLAIIEAITSLYKLSMTIRNPTPRDRYAKAASFNPFDASYDVGHVYEKFPHLRSKLWLMEKLGRAITRRREFLRYRETHREKLGDYNMSPTEPNDVRRKITYNEVQIPIRGPKSGLGAHSVGNSQLASTKATTYVAYLDGENMDTRSTAGCSDASYVTSIAEDDSDIMRQIPDLPKESANGKPFECQYCFMILAIKSTKQWKKHVLSDLQPYLCTFEGCSTQMFQSRHEWFQHELDEHRKEWRCCLCSNELPFSSIPQLEVHLRSKHSEYGEDQTTAFLSLCERPPQYIPVSACPICAWGSSRSINPAYPISMASGSLSKKFWDPFMVLDVNPDDPHSTCVGFAASTGKRCRWRFESDRFDTLQRDNAVKRLISMSEIHPSEANPAALYLIARATLCYWHQNQANSKSAEWKERIESYLIDHSERLAGVGAKQLKSGSARDKDASEKEIEETRQVLESVTSDLKELQAIWSELIDKDSKGDETQAAKSQDVALLWQKLTECRKRKEKIGDQLRSLLQEEHTPRSDLPAGGPNMRPHSRDRDFHKAPVLRADLSSPTVMVSSLQFQRHVAHHLEQLALFALPPPMNESSGASSNQAAASRKSDRKTGSDAISEVSSTSLAPTDHANPPELYAAVMSGDIARVMQEIRNGADLTFHYGRFGNVIQTAAASLSWPSRDEIIHILLDYGADANMQGGIYGNTLQAVAANPGESGRRLSALETLLDCGAEVNAAGGRYGHALIAAAAVPTPPSSMLHEPTSMVLKILLDHGANPDAQGPKLYGSALHQAIKHDDNESVQLLLDRGASTTIRHVDYGTPVHHAMKTAYEPVWRRLRNAAVETNLERHYDRVRLSSALKIQRLFRYRQHGSGIPAFLRLSQSTVRAQYNDLAWKEKLRILQGRSDPSSLWVQDTSPMIMKRNRYGNVQPWQKSRIHLKVAEGESDYINASPISLRDSQTGVETKFIATQGPKESTSSHFWHMVWQETTDVAVIVMLTQTHDGTTEKCFQYFPLNVEVESFKIESLDTAEDAPKGTVTLLEYYLDVDSRTEVRKLSLKFGIETKDVWHFLFLGWSDFAVPEDNDRIALLNLLKLYVKKNTSSSNPTIVHDSAGVGRVGTFIALEHLLAQVETGAILNANESEDVIYDLVNRLREQRMLMVQMELQYQFLYNMVLDQLKERCPDMMSETDHDAKSEPDSKR